MTLATVICNHTETFWEKSPESISLTSSADIWRIPVVSDLELLADQEALLLPYELEKSLRFRQLKDNHRFIIRKAVLRIILSKYLRLPETEIEFIIGENKKPGLNPIHKIELHYNVSHSGDWILIAVSDAELGVDIEQTDTEFDYTEVLRHSFGKEEIDYIQSKGTSKKAFFTLWTRKEALTKATSKGLDDDFPDIPCLDGKHQINTAMIWSEKNWVVSSFEVDKAYIGSIALSPSKPLRFFDFVIDQ